MLEGTLIRGRGGFYTVKSTDGTEYTLRAKKKFRHDHITPTIGDRVFFSPGSGDEHGWVEEILPRQNLCFRPQVANITRLCIVIAPKPEPDLLLIDKMLIYASKQNVSPLIIINKCELDDDECLYSHITQQYRNADAQVYRVSAHQDIGIDALRDALSNCVSCFCGQSGVGKSSLLNALFKLDLETGEISRKIERGKNTTRHTELFIMNGLSVMDTPGFSLLEDDSAPEDPIFLKDSYPEFASYEGQCRFQPCYHGSEPGCAVTTAVQEGKIDSFRVARYRQMLITERERWKNRYD